MASVFDMIFAAILVFFLTEGTSANEELAKEIDLFKAVGLGDKAFTDVTKTTGQNDKSAAYHFASKTPDLIASQKAFERTDKLIHNSHDFIVSAFFKIDPKAIDYYPDNPIVSISSQKGWLFFKLMVSANSQGTDLGISVTIELKGGLSRTFTTTKRYVDLRKWHKVAVRIQDTQHVLKIFVDDKIFKAFVFDYQIASYPQNATLRLAQVSAPYTENQVQINERFRGDLQDVKFRKGSSQDDCPKPPKCQCSDFVGTKECVMGGLRYEDGSRWTKDKCTVCQCKWGQVICTSTCQVCKDNGQTYLHGETWKSGNCQTCKCEDGKTTCSPPVCPKPDCSGKSGDTITLKGQCCPICKEDQCDGTGKVYKNCGCDTTCSTEDQASQCKSCTEGCFCPRGQVLNKDKKCIAQVRCTCFFKGKEYKPNESYEDACQFCLCLGGKMNCQMLC
ncbi:uncharacterized protein LOC144654718 [Oculina patagonica]